MIDQHAATSQLSGHPTISVVPLVFQSDPSNLGSHMHFFVTSVHRAQMPVIPCFADSSPLTHPLDAQTALQ
jgi:hypothetical protein